MAIVIISFCTIVLSTIIIVYIRARCSHNIQSTTSLHHIVVHTYAVVH